MRRPAAEIVVHYEMPCRCGRLLRGERQQSPRIVPCPNCGRKHFILARSPWLAPRAAATTEQAASVRLNRLLGAIVLGAALAMGLIFLLARPYLRRSIMPSADGRTLLEAGEAQLREGNVLLALKELNAAIAWRDRHADALSRAEHHRLEQLHRQCDLLSRLLDQPLEEIVRQAMQHRDDDEWHAKFEHYRGRSVIFDDVLRHDAHGRPVLGFYAVRVENSEARIALEDLELVRQWPLDPPRRWLFGARLASCRREEGGIWVLRFETDSAVLLTDEIAAAACCPGPLDKELLAVLKRQDEWLRR